MAKNSLTTFVVQHVSIAGEVPLCWKDNPNRASVSGADEVAGQMFGRNQL